MPKRSTANSATIPPPIQGWNTRDPISGMNELYAVEAENFIAKDGGVELRDGSRYYAKSIGPTHVGTLASFQYPNTGIDQLFAISVLSTATNESRGYAYNATAGGAAVVVSFDTNPANQFFSFNRVAPTTFKGSILWVTQSDPLPKYIISYWNPSMATDASTFLEVSGAPIAIGTYRGRIFLVDASNPQGVTYGQFDVLVGSSAGTYSFASLLTKGGQIVYVGNIPRSQQLMDEYFICITTLGETLIYQGSDPGSTTWNLVGHYQIPPPMGARAFVPFGNDLLVMTKQGIVSIAQIMQSGDSLSFISDNIAKVFSEASISSNTDIYANGAWCPNLGLIVFNIPTEDTTTPSCVQVVYEVKTQSWWKWVGLRAYMWANHNGTLYFASSNGRVFKITGDWDEDPANEGSVLTRDIKLRPAYNYFGDRSTSKQFVEARPIIKQSEGLTLTMSADVDYKNVTGTSSVTDLTDTSYKLYTPRVGLRAIGRCASIRIDGTVTTKKMRLEATEVIWNDGDI